MSEVRVLFSDTFNPWFNLATEDWIFRELEPDAQTLFLWRNIETVVIGRNQNPWSECNLNRMEMDGVTLARRTTGGGAVFHDLGNTCFTFLSPRGAYDRTRNVGILLKALSRFGIQAEASGRNDIVVHSPDDLRKVSGSAYRETKERAFHHGTLLRHANLTRLEDYLTPHPKKLQSKGRASVRTRVANLGDLNADLQGEGSHERLSDAVIEAFCEAYQAKCVVQRLDHSSLQKIESLKAMYDQMASWEWRFGHAPQFSIELTEYLSWGFMQIFIDSERGHVSRAQVFSDALFPDVIEDFGKELQGRPYNPAGVKEAVAATRIRHPERTQELTELENWLVGEVSR